MLRVEAGVGGVGAVVEEVLLAVGTQDVGVSAANAACTLRYRARLAPVSLDQLARGDDLRRGRGCAGAVHLHVRQAAIVPMSPMPPEPRAPLRPLASTPCGRHARRAFGAGQAGVITGRGRHDHEGRDGRQADGARDGAKAADRPVGSEGRHRSAAHPAIRASSRIALTRSIPPSLGMVPSPGRSATRWARGHVDHEDERVSGAPSHSQSRDGRHSTTAAQPPGPRREQENAP